MKSPNEVKQESSYLDTDQLTGYTTTWKPCTHIGYYFTVKFWIFHKEMFWCMRCLEAIPKKIIDVQKKARLTKSQ